MKESNWFQLIWASCAIMSLSNVDVEGVNLAQVVCGTKLLAINFRFKIGDKVLDYAVFEGAYIVEAAGAFTVLLS